MLPFFEQDHLSLRARAREWVEKKLFPSHERSSAGDRRAIRLAKELGSEGFLKYTVPQDFGGLRSKIQARDLCILREELARGDALADTMFAMQALGGYPIVLAGNETQKQQFLPAIAQGDCIAAFAITERDAGSDVMSLQTRATRRGKEFCVSGTKCFISNAGIADSYVVFASTEPEKKGKGITAFVLEGDTPGLLVKERTELLSPHPMGVVEFENCVVSEDSRLGAEGQGWQSPLQLSTFYAARSELPRLALPSALWKKRFGTAKRVGNSAGRFLNSKASSSSLPRWRLSWKQLNYSSTKQPGLTIAEGLKSNRKRQWQSITPRKPRSALSIRHCRSTVATA